MYSFIWLAFTVILIFIEAVTVNVVCIWFIAGGAAALISSLFLKSVWAELIIFLIVSALAVWFTKPIAEKLEGKHHTATNADSLIGRICTVTERVTPQIKGRAKIDDVSWLAESNTVLEVGSEVKISEVHGATLTVIPIEKQ
jgi:membrane protein implicated in regulation of membrane protease activity